MRFDLKTFCDFPGDATDGAKLRALRVAGWFLIVGPFLYLALVFLSFPDQAGRSIGPALVLILAAASLLLMSAGKAQCAARVLVYGTFAALVPTIAMHGGLQAPQTIALPLAVLLAGWLLGVRHAAALTMLGIALVLGLAAYPAGLPQAPSNAIMTAFPIAVVVLLTGLLTAYIVHSNDRRVEEVRRLGEALAAEKSQLAQIAENIPAFIFHGDRELRCRYANRRYAEFFGFTPENIVGKSVADILGEESARAIHAKLQSVLAGETVRYGAVRRSAADGKEHHLDIAFVPENNESGEVVGFYALKQDVTEQRVAEQALRANEAWLRLASDSAKVGFWEWDVNTDTLTWNDRLKAIFGLSASEQGLTLPRFLRAIHPDDLAETQALFMAALAQHHEFNHEYRIVWPDGSVHWIVALGHGIYGTEGQPVRMTGAAFDITERKQAEEKFAKVFQISPVSISISRLRDGQYLEVNEALVRQFGWSREEILGHTSVEIGIWHCLADRDRWIAELRKSGRLKSYEVSIRIKSGEQRTVLMSSEQFSLDGEECVLNSAHDITELRRTEDALRKNEARLQEAQRIGRFGSWELDLPSRMFTWSEEIAHIFETTMPSDSVSYEAFLSNIHPEDRALFDKDFVHTIAEGKSNQFTYRLCMPDGRIKFVHVRAETLLDADGKPVKVIGTTQDITEQQLAQQEIHRLNADLETRVRERTAELQSANKELESFAYSISHDLRAPLRGIDGFSHLLAEEYGERLDALGHSYLERVRAAAQRMGALIDDILELSRVTRMGMQRMRVDLSQLALEAAEERSRASPGHAVEFSIQPGCFASGDPQLLRVLMQNLIENAWKYSSREPAPQIAFGSETQDGEIAFFVRDNGVGFDMKYAGRLFTPFQRLHKPEEFEGTGIGLATVARVVHRHGGRVWVESAVGAGTTLRFTLGSAA
ncbi:MAG: PAS domain S-box protein [Rhodocyclaceae bacterium]|nr:PAS domain S-box protein [Rhodocyclaceae bacterium]